MAEFQNLEEAYTKLVEALNYLEANDEDPTPQDGDIFLVGKTSSVIWNRWAQKFEFKVHMGIERESENGN